MKGKLLFEEEQSFVGTWMWYLVIGISFLSIGGVVLSIWQAGVNSERIIGLVITSVVILAVTLLLSFAKLSVSIDSSTIYYQFPPFVNSEKALTRNDISEVYVRKYRPIWEYGGWGYRIKLGKGRAMNVAGNMGLQLILKNNKAILLGTQKPEEMERALKRLKENWSSNG